MRAQTKELYKVYLRIPTKSGTEYYIPASLTYNSYNSAVSEALLLTRRTGNYHIVRALDSRTLEGIEQNASSN